MTDKEARRIIIQNTESLKANPLVTVDNCLYEAFDRAIQALEQQLCEDCISRQAVLDIIDFEDKWLFDANGHNANTHIAFSGLESRVKALPPVTPKYTDEEIDKAQAVEQAYVDKMVELAVEEAKRPKGKWIDIEIDAGEFIYKCSKCGMRVINPYKYCPICGSYNGGNDNGDE